jgi:hypothetical protein
MAVAVFAFRSSVGKLHTSPRKLTNRYYEAKMHDRHEWWDCLHDFECTSSFSSILLLLLRSFLFCYLELEDKKALQISPEETYPCSYDMRCCYNKRNTGK